MFSVFSMIVNPLRPEQNGCRFAKNASVLNDKVFISIQISLNFVRKGWIDDKSS